MGLGLVVALLADQTASDLTRLDRTKQTFDPTSDDRYKTERVAEAVLLGVGAAALASGITCYALGRRRPRAVSLMPELRFGRQHGIAALRIVAFGSSPGPMSAVLLKKAMNS